MASIETSTVTPIKIALLVDAPENVRKSGSKEAHDVLKASIRAKGVLQNLVVYATDNGKFAVTAGRRRRAALLALLKEKAITKSFEVPCLVRTRADAIALSLAENVNRENMHPADEFAAFKALIDNGQPIEDVAAEFGVTPAVVRRRLKLACLSPVILDAFRGDKLNLNQVMGFTLTDDHTKQEAVFNDIRTRLAWIKREAIAHMLTERKIPTSDRLYIFAGEEYVAAGGTLTADLFDDEGHGYADDGGLLHQVATAKLEALAGVERAKGWKWVNVSLEHSIAPHGFRRIDKQPMFNSDEDRAAREALCNQIDAMEVLAEERDLTDEERATFEKLADELDALDDRSMAFAPEAMALAGGWLTVDDRGQPYFRAAYVKPEDCAALEGLYSATMPTDRRIGTIEGEHVQQPKAVSGPKLTDALLTLLHKERTGALRVGVFNDPDTALGLLVYHMAASAFIHSTDRILTVATQSYYSTDSQALQAWRDRLPDDQGELFAAIMTMDRQDIMALLAALVSLQVDASYQKANPQAGCYAKPGPLAELLATHLRLDMSKVWEPTEDNYFRHVNKTQVLDAVREAKGTEAATAIASLKKGPLCVEAARIMKGSRWLPATLRTKA